MVHWKNLQKRWSPILSYLSLLIRFVFELGTFFTHDQVPQVCSRLRFRVPGYRSPLFTFENQGGTRTSRWRQPPPLVPPPRSTCWWMRHVMCPNEKCFTRECPTLKKNYGEVPQNYTPIIYVLCKFLKNVGFHNATISIRCTYSTESDGGSKFVVLTLGQPQSNNISPSAEDEIMN